MCMCVYFVWASQNSRMRFLLKMGFERGIYLFFSLSRKNIKHISYTSFEQTLNNIPFIVECQICNQQRALGMGFYFLAAMKIGETARFEKKFAISKNKFMYIYIYRVRDGLKMIVWSFATLFDMFIFIFSSISSDTNEFMIYIFFSLSPQIFSQTEIIIFLP